jgi:hypothetical protein
MFVLIGYVVGACVYALCSWTLDPGGPWPPPWWLHAIGGVFWPVALATDVWERAWA